MELNKKQLNNIKQLTSWKFTLYMVKHLPMGFLAGLKIDHLSAKKCTTSVPFNYLTKNPFQSMYFAVQSMAAELSTASTCLLAVTGQSPSIAFIIVDCSAEFHKKATSKVFFTCHNAAKAFEAVEECKQTNEPVTVTFETEGRMKDGTLVSTFKFTWSFKVRKS